jgi:hypothetical protein
MKPITILFATASAGVLFLMIRIKYRLMRRQKPGKRHVGNSKVIVFPAPQRGAGTVQVVNENQFCKNLQGY